MSSKKNSKVRTSKDANPKKFKKKTSILVTDKVEYIDYKDVNLLTRFVSDRSKIRNRRVTGNDVQQQREIANAVKNAREMALLPYTKRVSQTRTSRAPRDGDNRRSERSEEQVVSQVESTEVESTEIESTEVETAEVVDEIVEA